ncbi:MAG: dTDP-4-dehydrorhamnose 3,5-epimerase family protein [Elusimicrobia bacterium]|nr:dTDP-4-dehydrorhamnose 3,5-epimerase family protein [Elusimicrobiota bacterium]
MPTKTSPKNKESSTEVEPIPDPQKPALPKTLIEGVRVRPLKAIPDERGRLMELLRSDWPEFIEFGQCYLTTAYPGAVKGWHYHKKQTDNFLCIRGMMKLVLYDPRKKSKTFRRTNEFFIGDHNPCLVQIPPWVYHGIKCIGPEEAIIVNLPTALYDYHDPDEYRLPAHTPRIAYDWSRKDG